MELDVQVGQEVGGCVDCLCLNFILELKKGSAGSNEKGITTYFSSSLRIVCHFLLALPSRQTFLIKLLLELSNHADRPSIIPHNRATQRLSRLLVPAQRRLSLVGNTDTLDARSRESQELELFHSPGDAFLDTVDEVLRFVFVPVWVGVVLCVFGLVFADDFGVLVKDDESGGAMERSAKSAGVIR